MNISKCEHLISIQVCVNTMTRRKAVILEKQLLLLIKLGMGDEAVSKQYKVRYSTVRKMITSGITFKTAVI